MQCSLTLNVTYLISIKSMLRQSTHVDLGSFRLYSVWNTQKQVSVSLTAAYCCYLFEWPHGKLGNMSHKRGGGQIFFMVMMKKVGWQNGKAKFTCSKGVQCSSNARLGFEVGKHCSIFSHFHPSLLSRVTIQVPFSFLSLSNCTIRSLSRFPWRWWFYKMAYFPLTKLPF